MWVGRVAISVGNGISMNDDDAIQQTAYDILSATARRFVLAHLNEQQRPVPLSTVADAFFAWERGVVEAAAAGDGDGDDGEGRLRAEIALHHVHLPLLHRAGVLDYDDANRVVTGWRHDDLHARWLDDPPVASLARTVADNRVPPARPVVSRRVEDAS